MTTVYDVKQFHGLNSISGQVDEHLNAMSDLGWTLHSVSLAARSGEVVAMVVMTKTLKDCEP